LKSLDASGSFLRSPSILTYDKLSSLPQAIFWRTILAPILIAFMLTSYCERHIETRIHTTRVSLV